jgi:Bromodomain associated
MPPSAASQQHSRRLPKDDLLYAHGIARRAVARAALHLGIDCMTGETLDTLSACLLTYLERLGGAMAHTSEASGRTSAHCHVLDALAAVELCTPPAAIQTTVATAMGSPIETLEASTNGESHIEGASSGASSWKDLASFCFGPQWHQSSVGAASLVDALNGSSSAGWNAPYPEEVPHFPRVVTKSAVANPHPFPEPKLHRQDVIIDGATEPEVTALQDNEDIPDTAFQDAAGWGGIRDEKPVTQSGDKRPLENADDEDSKPAAKRVKLHDGTAAATEGLDWAEALPTFYPPFPSKHMDDQRVVFAEGTAAAKMDATTTPLHSWTAKATETAAEREAHPPTRLRVRTALLGSRTGVHRGGGDGPADSTRAPSYWGAVSADRVVPAGRPAMDASAAPSIVPIGRASGSRVSRILEGSMEPPVL